MKIAIILAALFLLTYSDLYIPSNLPEEDDELYEMDDICSEAESNRGQCLSIQLSNNHYQCCMWIETLFGKTERECSAIPGDISLLQNAFNDNMFKAQLKEIFGYVKYSNYYIDYNGNKQYIDVVNLKFKETYECKDGIAEYSYGYETYTDTEIANFQSGNHCLEYFYRYLYPENYDENLNLNTVSKSDCQNAELTQSAKDAGIKCGFYQFKINFVNKGSKTYQTCYAYNSKMIENKKLDEKTQGEITLLINKFAIEDGSFEAYTSYTTELTDDSGKTYAFDMTGALAQQSSNILNKAKYLYLLIILFML